MSEESNIVVVALMAVSVRRDAHTITDTTVTAYEVPMLAKKFDKENVVVGARVGSREVDPATEYERLSSKYGGQHVKALYGDDGGLRLAEMVEKAAAAAAAPAKKDKAAAKPGDNQ